MKTYKLFIVIGALSISATKLVHAQTDVKSQTNQRLTFKNIEMGQDAVTVLKLYKPKNGWGESYSLGSGPFCWVRIPTQTLNIEPKQEDLDTVGSAAATVSFTFRIESEKDFIIIKNGMRPQLSETSTETRLAMSRVKLFKISCTFKRISYHVLKDALTAKFGIPALSDTIEVKNGLGASFAIERVTWKSNGGIVSIQEGRIQGSR